MLPVQTYMLFRPYVIEDKTLFIALRICWANLIT